MLIGAVSVPTASAGLVEKTTDTVGSTVDKVKDTTKSVEDTATAVEGAPTSVQDTTTSVPSLPSASPPPNPPSAPTAPALPRPDSVKSPTKDPPSAPPRSSADPADLPPADGVAGAARGAVGSVRDRRNEATPNSATPERSDPGATAAMPPRRAEGGAGEASVRESRTASDPPIAVRPAAVAALQRWLARVWPAIALGGGEVGAVGAVVGAVARDLLRPALAALTGVLLASSPVLPTSAAPLPLDGRQGVGDAPRSAPDSPPAVPAGGEGGGALYLIAVAALLGLLGFTIWREFRVALHPRLR